MDGLLQLFSAFDSNLTYLEAIEKNLINKSKHVKASNWLKRYKILCDLKSNSLLLSYLQSLIVLQLCRTSRTSNEDMKMPLILITATR